MRTKIDIENDILYAERELENLSRMTDEQIAAMQRIQWWNFDGEQLKDVERLLFDIDAFIAKYDTK